MSALPLPMNKVIVVVIDDQLVTENPNDSRIEVYKLWLERLGQALAGKWEIEPKFCENPIAFTSLNISAGAQVLAVVDMVLEGGDWTTTAVEELDHRLGESAWPLLLVSARFDSAQAISRVNRLAVRAKSTAPRQFMMWSAIQRAVDGFDFSEIAFIVDSVLSRSLEQELGFKKGESEPIEILHITDPHFGKAKWDVGTLMSLRVCRHNMQREQSADFIVVSGDVADKGEPSQYALAADYLESLTANRIAELGNSSFPSPRLFMCPGNHDFSRPIALAANLESKPPYAIGQSVNTNAEWIRHYAWAPYFDFESKCSGTSGKNWLLQPGYRIDSRYGSSGLLFLMLNLEKYDIDGYQDGFTPAELRKTVNNAVTAIDKIRRANQCVVVVAHRFAADVWQELWSMISNNLTGLAAGGPLIYLCGHDHTSSVSTECNNSVLVVRGLPPVPGSSLPSQELPTIGSIVLERKNCAVTHANVIQFGQHTSGWKRLDDGEQKYAYIKRKWSLAVG